MSAPPSSGRGRFGSRLGFILAAAGSAIGLGNIWRFPYLAGEHGGGAFVLVYLVFVLGIGVPVMLAEFALGRNTQRNPVGAFKALFPDSAWPWLGRLGVVTGFAVLSFYSVVAGWTLSYLWKATAGVFSKPVTADESSRLFTESVADPVGAIALSGVFMLLTVIIVRRGIVAGIETASKILMPLFFVLLLVLAARSMTLPGAGRGLEFMFKADFSKLGPQAILAALGQALFSLSLGMGGMLTYASYLSKQENLVLGGISVAFFDTLVALLGGLIVFPALFHANADPSAGPGLVFVVLPTIFDKLPGGTLFAIAFYVLLALAALTSTISLLEVVVSYFIDERGWTRERAVWQLGGGCFVLAIPSALSNGAVHGLTELFTLGGESKSFLDVFDLVFGNYALTLGALLLSVFVGWKWGTGPALDELRAGGGGGALLAGFWGISIRFVCPAAMFAVLVSIAMGD